MSEWVCVWVLPVSIICSNLGLVRAFLPLMMGMVWERACRWPSPPDDAILESTAANVVSCWIHTYYLIPTYTAADALLNLLPVRQLPYFSTLVKKHGTHLKKDVLLTRYWLPHGGTETEAGKSHKILQVWGGACWEYSHSVSQGNTRWSRQRWIKTGQWCSHLKLGVHIVVAFSLESIMTEY